MSAASAQNTETSTLAGDDPNCLFLANAGFRLKCSAYNAVTSHLLQPDAFSDTVDIDHPDRNVAGGRNFVRGANDDAFGDGNGHGTHVAGTIGALDDGNGIVGVAPGISIWAAKVFGNNGRGKSSDLLAGLDWIACTSRGWPRY